MRSSVLIRGTVALTAAAVSATLLTAGQTGAGAASTPPFEPTANAVGTITFYNSAGAVITHGSTDTGPFAAYAVGSVAPHAGDTQAGIAFANPDPKAKPYAWYAEQSGPFSSYPVTTGPASITGQGADHPVYTGASGDVTLDQFEATAVQHTGTGYTNVVQIRLQTASSGVTKTYDDADLLIDPTNNTWTELYPTNAGGGTVTPDTTSVSLAVPATVKYGASAKITGTLKDTTTSKALSAQTVKLYERANSKATAKLVKQVKSGSSGALSATVTLTGAEQFQWRYPATSAHKSAKSSYKSVAVSTAVSASVNHSTVAKGKTATFYGSTTPATSGIKVDLQQLVGKTWKTVATGVQKKQKLPSGKTTVGFVIARKLGTKGTFSFRVMKPATSALKSSVSKTITEHVK